MAETVTITHPQHGERVVGKNAVPFFENQGYEVVKTAKAATSTSKDK